MCNFAHNQKPQLLSSKILIASNRQDRDPIIHELEELLAPRKPKSSHARRAINPVEVGHGEFFFAWYFAKDFATHRRHLTHVMNSFSEARFHLIRFRPPECSAPLPEDETT